MADQTTIVSAAENAAQSLGYTELKDKQLEVIVNLLLGNDVFATLPTGYGKSLCYACLPKAFDTILKTEGSIIVVVTPLVAIIKDQVCVYLSVSVCVFECECQCVCV